MQEVRQIYRDHGWPDDFRLEECCSALWEWNETIDERLREPGNDLQKINREPPRPDDNPWYSDGEEDHEEADDDQAESKSPS